ncbi:ribbon-helix-helix DNA binding domain protein [Microbacterium phage Kelcole]|nr:ribbon-helix-helix DNA binding domain protein [Microbacterium phage Kelcole]
MNLRLNDAEHANLEVGRSRRGLEVSDYFRTLLEEDTRDHQS